MISDWIPTLFLIFAGCCSNAVTLEQLTSSHPHSGSLITFFQFLVVSLYGLPKHIIWTPYGPRFKPRTVPLTPYLVQVALFYLISLLNNAAFAYHIPMSVHIIFRSGGLVITLLLGWLVGKRYTLTQVISVCFVTIGVVLTTLSASGSKTSPSKSPSASTSDTTGVYSYATGIAILTFALLLSGFLGLVQDWTYSTYGRPSLNKSSAATPTANAKQDSSGPNLNSATSPANKVSKRLTSSSSTWQESMFYLHFLSLPMFYFIRTDISNQLSLIHSSDSPKILLPLRLSPALESLRLFSTSNPPTPTPAPTLTLDIPTVYLPLLLNTLTQLICVAGVNRLTTRVSALTVTLILVVRKAVSLVLSVLGVGVVIKYGEGGKGSGGSSVGRVDVDVDVKMMWSGAALVMLGTIGYSLGSKRKVEAKEKKA
ncbi:hypothetical protein AX17_004975 [Amanita inopinata Kibby_2008]|nr:hypothetical protein AX17_004975 [Amanita inopinata Kibby_2008]